MKVTENGRKKGLNWVFWSYVTKGILHIYVHYSLLISWYMFPPFWKLVWFSNFWRLFAFQIGRIRKNILSLLNNYWIFEFPFPVNFWMEVWKVTRLDIAKCFCLQIQCLVISSPKCIFSLVFSTRWTDTPFSLSQCQCSD